ncbi:MAG: DinB family protein [Gemmatimonadaceae bacterium]
MTEIDAIVDQMRRAHDGDPWYGSPLRAVLSGITAEQAAMRPVPGAGAHSIWEIVLHMMAWKREVTSRLAGGIAKLPDVGDWPAVTRTDEEAWTQAKRRLGDAHQALLEATATFPAERLQERPNDPRNRETGSGVSFYVTLHGITQHDVYHTGQIALLKKALSASA